VATRLHRSDCYFIGEQPMFASAVVAVVTLVMPAPYFLYLTFRMKISSENETDKSITLSISYYSNNIKFL